MRGEIIGAGGEGGAESRRSSGRASRRGQPRQATEDDAYGALAVLRTFRAKLASALEVAGDSPYLVLTINAKPVDGEGTLGGTDLTLTPQNLITVNLAMMSGGEAPIQMLAVPPAESRSDTEIGISGENVAAVLPRVSRSIDNTLGQIHSRREIARTHIGLTAFHLSSDRDGAAAQINTQIQTIKNVVLTAAGVDPSLVSLHDDTAEKIKAARLAHEADPLSPGFSQKVLDAKAALARSKYAPLWFDVVAPIYDEWNSFYADKKHWYDYVTTVFTSWEEYLAWADRVNSTRAIVEAAGLKIYLPKLTKFPQSIQDKVQDVASSVWDFTKIAAYVGLGLGVVVVGAFAVKAAK